MGYKYITSLSLYGLGHAAYHYAVNHNSDELWRLCKDEGYRKEQYERSKQFEWGYETLRYGLFTYVDLQGQTSQGDARLAWIVLKCGEYAKEAVEGIEVAFDWFEEDVGRLDDALKRIEVLGEKAYFKASLRLLTIEAWRQRDFEARRRNSSIPKKILEQIDERIADGTGTINWSSFLSKEFMVWWITLMMETWSSIDLGAVYRRGVAVVSILSNIATELSKSENFEEALNIAHSISNDDKRAEALLSIIKEFTDPNQVNIIPNHLSKASYSDIFYEQFLSEYQQCILGTAHFCDTFLYAPFSFKLSRNSVLNFIAHHYKNNNEVYAHAIIQHCSELSRTVP